MLERLSFVLLLILLQVSAKAQSQPLTLSDCIALAKKNNIGGQQAKLEAERSSVRLKTAQYSRLPNFNINAGNNYNFGRTIDPFSNTFINRNITAFNMNASTSVPIYNGGAINEQIKAAEVNKQAQQKNVESIENNIELDVAGLYLQALLAEEQIKVFENNIGQSKELLKQAKAQIEAGTGILSQRLELEAQLSNDKLRKTNAENNARISLVNLANYLNITNPDDIEIAKPLVFELDTASTNQSLSQVVQENFKELPQVKRDELQLEAAEYNLAAAQAGQHPSLAFRANVNSLYSSQSQIATNARSEILKIGYVEGSQATVLTQRQVFDYTKPGFFNQLDNNLGQSIGINLNIPVFTRNVIAGDIENAKINHQNAMLQLRSTQNQIRNQIYEAFYNYVAAVDAYKANLSVLKSQEKLFEQTQVQYDAGTLNYFDWQTVRNALNNAELNLLTSKYELLFRERIYKFYLGEEVKL